jgi:single-strand DNA-binding protein
VPNLNRVTLIGYLTADPEQKPAGDTTVTKFVLGVTERWKDNAGEKQEHTNWIPVAVWNGKGENLAAYLKKGSCVLVEGSIRVTQYEENGARRYYTEVRGTNVVFLDKKKTETTPAKRATRPRAVQ